MGSDADTPAGRPFLMVGLLGLDFKKATARGGKRRGKLTGGRWVTDDDGHHLYIAGGRVVAGRGVQSASGGMHRAKPKPGGGGGGGGGGTAKPTEAPRPAAKPAAAPAKPEPVKPAPKPEPPKPAAVAKPEPKPAPKPEPPKPAAQPAKPLGPARDLGEASTKEIAAHHESMSADWKKGLNFREDTAISGYSSSLYQQINSFHRTGQVPEHFTKKGVQDISKGMDSALGKARLKEDTIVYRGVKDLKALGIDPANPVGHTLKDSTYLSTSLNPKIAERFLAGESGGAILKIRAPKGSKGASIAGLTNQKGEHEVLFHRGSSLKVVGHSKDARGRTVLEMELSHG